MNKSEIVDHIAEHAGISKAEADKALGAFTELVVSSLQRGQSVSLLGFGTFSVKERGARMGRNPSTGESIQIAASKAPGFKAGKTFKDALN